MRLKKAVLTVCVMMITSGIKAQYYHGDNRNDEHSDRRDATDRYLHDRR